MAAEGMEDAGEVLPPENVSSEEAERAEKIKEKANDYFRGKLPCSIVKCLCKHGFMS